MEALPLSSRFFCKLPYYYAYSNVLTLSACWVFPVPLGHFLRQSHAFHSQLIELCSVNICWIVAWMMRYHISYLCCFLSWNAFPICLTDEIQISCKTQFKGHLFPEVSPDPPFHWLGSTVPCSSGMSPLHLVHVAITSSYAHEPFKGRRCT